MKKLHQLNRTMTLVAAALILAGCGTTSGYKQAEKTGAGVAEFRNEIVNGKKAVDATIQSLGLVATTANTDPRKPFQQYSKDLASLESATAKVQKRGEELKTKGEAFFKQWQQQSATVQNPEIRKLAEEQRTKSQAAFDNIQKYTGPLKAQFNPWLSDLRDLRTYLGSDLTVSGIDAARGQIQKAQSQGIEIQNSMDALVTELNNVVTTLTPATETATATATAAPAK